ncbi:hypothetical protein GCM10027162_45740 [Streptomyces incanus]
MLARHGYLLLKRLDRSAVLLEPADISAVSSPLALALPPQHAARLFGAQDAGAGER